MRHMLQQHAPEEEYLPDSSGSSSIIGSDETVDDLSLLLNFDASEFGGTAHEGP